MVKPAGDDKEPPLAPFLRKCYEMVEDESTDAIISWGGNGNTFIIWDTTQFAVRLLPKHFKHGNFSSFMRQLNIYGFRKVDTDRWEFANDGFIKGQKHLMQNICRRKNVQLMDQKKSLQKEQESSVEAVDKIEKDGLLQEVETLKNDKNALAQELAKLRQLQETSENKLVLLRDRLQGMETSQQQLLSFLVMAMQNPGFLAQLLHLKENYFRVTEMGNMLEQEAGMQPLISDGAIVKYQPQTVSRTNPEFPSLAGTKETPESGLSFDGTRDKFMNNDFMAILMNEKISLDTPFVLPDFPDDGAWEQLLLSCPFIEGVGEEKQDKEGFNNLAMGTESTVSQDFEALVRQMGNCQDVEAESDVDADDWEDGSNVDCLTEQMEHLSSKSALEVRAP